jgi:microcystin-dependent protein
MAQTRSFVDVQPAGMISAFGNSTAPTGWLQCNGAAVSRTTYADLFTAIGTVYGTGDGSTTFNVPEIRGEFVRAWDNGRGVDSGRTIGSFQDATGIDDSSGDAVGIGYDNADSAIYNTQTVNSSPGIAGASGSYPRWRIRPRNVAPLYCIKY